VDLNCQSYKLSVDNSFSHMDFHAFFGD